MWNCQAGRWVLGRRKLGLTLSNLVSSSKWRDCDHKLGSGDDWWHLWPSAGWFVLKQRRKSIPSEFTNELEVNFNELFDIFFGFHEILSWFQPFFHHFFMVYRLPPTKKILAEFFFEEHPEWWPELQPGASSFEEFQAHQLLGVGDHLKISQKKGGDGVMTLSSFSAVWYQLLISWLLVVTVTLWPMHSTPIIGFLS